MIVFSTPKRHVLTSEKNFNLRIARSYFCCKTSTSQDKLSTFFWLDFNFDWAEINALFSFSWDPSCLCNSTSCSLAFLKGSANFLFSLWTVAKSCSFRSSLSSFPLISSFNVLKTSIEFRWSCELMIDFILRWSSCSRSLQRNAYTLAFFWIVVMSYSLL